MRNNILVEMFVNGRNKGSGSNLFIADNVLYSYGWHFPVAVRLTDGWIVNRKRFSSSTTAHQNMLARSLGYNSLNDAIENPEEKGLMILDTNKIKLLIDKGFKSKGEILFDDL